MQILIHFGFHRLLFHKFSVILGPEKFEISVLAQSVFLEDDGILKGTFPSWKLCETLKALVLLIQNTLH